MKLFFIFFWFFAFLVDRIHTQASGNCETDTTHLTKTFHSVLGITASFLGVSLLTAFAAVYKHKERRKTVLEVLLGAAALFILIGGLNMIFGKIILKNTSPNTKNQAISISCNFYIIIIVSLLDSCFLGTCLLGVGFSRMNHITPDHQFNKLESDTTKQTELGHIP